MLKINVKETISFDDYLNILSLIKMIIKIKLLILINIYKILIIIAKILNFIFIFCLNKHNKHQIFFKIGLKNEEISIIDNLLNEIEKYINPFNKIKKDIKLFFNKMK